VVTRVKEPVLAEYVRIPGIPEPGVVALLGFGLVLLALSFVHTNRADGKLRKKRSEGQKEGQKMVDNSASKGLPL
jgi:hypothetical protein